MNLETASYAINSHTADRLMFWGFCGLFFFIPVATSPAVIVGVLTLAIWIFSGKIVKDYKKWLDAKWIYPVLFFVLLPWAGLLYTSDLRTGLIFATKTQYWLYAFAVSTLPFDNYKRETLINSFVTGLSLTAFVSIFQFAGLFPMINPFPTGFMSHINLSLFLVLGLLILAFRYKTACSRGRKALIAGLMAVYFISLSISAGRIGFLALIILSPWMFYTMFGDRYPLKAGGAAAILSVILLMLPPVQERLEHARQDMRLLEQGKKATSLGIRLYMWEGAARLFLERPLLGVGTGGYKNEMRRLRDDPAMPNVVQPHNGFLYMAASFGLAGIASVVWLFAAYLKGGWRNRRGLVGFSVFAFGFVMMIGNMTDSQMLSLSTAMMFALLTGLTPGAEDETTV